MNLETKLIGKQIHLLSTVPSCKSFPQMHPLLCDQSSFPDQAGLRMRASDHIKRKRNSFINIDYLNCWGLTQYERVSSFDVFHGRSIRFEGKC